MSAKRPPERSLLLRICGRAAVVGIAGAVALACGPAPTPESLVKKMSDRLAEAKSFSVSTEEMHERRKGEGKVEVRFSRDVVVRRPDGMAFTLRGEEREASGAYDGKSFTLVWPHEKAWARVKMPATIDGMLDRVAERFNVAMPVGDLLYSSPYDVLMSPDTTGRIAGRETIEGLDCDHLAFTHEKVDWEIWIARSGDPVPCKLAITTKGRSGPLTSEVTFSNWNLAASAGDEAFAARVPEDYERIMMLARNTTSAETPAEPAKGAR